MKNSILYLGDTQLNQAGCYLAGIMTYCGIGFDYLASDEPISDSLLDMPYRAIIISDYPSSNFTASQLNQLQKLVSNGMGLFMIGGWDSYHGLGGFYNTTILSEILPVIMSGSDDRINSSSPSLVVKNQPHVITDSLPFDNNAPTVGGFNLLTAKADSATILSVKMFTASRSGNDFILSEKLTAPLLVCGDYGLGKTCAFSSDVAPHWVGGLVDWGATRVNACAAGSIEIEVGSDYVKLFSNIINWVMQK